MLHRFTCHLLVGVLLSLGGAAMADVDAGEWTFFLLKRGNAVGFGNFVVSKDGELKGDGFDDKNVKFTHIKGEIEEDEIRLEVRQSGYRKTTTGKVHEVKNRGFVSKFKDGTKMVAYLIKPGENTGFYMGVDTLGRLSMMFINDKGDTGYYVWNSRYFLTLIGKERAGRIDAKFPNGDIRVAGRVRRGKMTGAGTFAGEPFHIRMIFWKGL